MAEINKVDGRPDQGESKSSTGYDLSVFDLPPGKGASKPRAEQSVNALGAEGYDLSKFGLEGLTSFELPARNPDVPGKSEMVRAKDLGHHIAEQVKRGFRVSSGEAINVFHWYLGCAKGAELMDAGTIGHLEKLSRGFAVSSDPAKFFKEQIRPFLNSLTPKGRK